MTKLYYDSFLHGLIRIKALRVPIYSDRYLAGPVSWEGSNVRDYLVVEVLRSGPAIREGRRVSEGCMAYQKGERFVCPRHLVKSETVSGIPEALTMRETL